MINIEALKKGKLREGTNHTYHQYKRYKDTKVIHYNNGVIAVRLRDINIITITADEITLNVEGWYASVFKKRINEVLQDLLSPHEYVIYRSDYRWYFQAKKEGEETAKLYWFNDGMTINKETLEVISVKRITGEEPTEHLKNIKNLSKL